MSEVTSSSSTAEGLELELESVNCPDCRLQLLQQQQQQNQQNSSSSCDIGGPPPRVLSSSSVSSLPEVGGYGGLTLGKLGGGGGYVTPGDSYIRSSYHHAYGGGSDYVGGGGSSINHQGGGISSSVPSSSSSAGHHEVTLTESACEYGSSTGSSWGSRPHHIPFPPPPLFYPQGPCSMLPPPPPPPGCGFSTISDWTNEYSTHYHHGYAASFVGAAVPTPTPSSASVVPSSSGVTGVGIGPSSSSSLSSCSQPPEFHHQIQRSTSNNEPQPGVIIGGTSISTNAYHHQYDPYPIIHNSNPMPTYYGGNGGMSSSSSTTSSRFIDGISGFTNSITSSANNDDASDTKEISKDNPNISPIPEKNSERARPPSSSINPPASSTPLNSPNSSAEVSESEDSSSEDGDSSSLASEDRELISVVEEDDEDEEEIETESTRGRSLGKCMVCQNPIEITDCTSPQLARILENIEEVDIDLDMTVSSGDIEIGGMEDEGNKETNVKRHRQFSGPGGILTLTRLALLLNLPSKNMLNLVDGTESDVAILCFRCGKVASLADSLERQLTSTIQTLQNHWILRRTSSTSGGKEGKQLMEIEDCEMLETEPPPGGGISSSSSSRTHFLEKFVQTEEGDLPSTLNQGVQVWSEELVLMMDATTQCECETEQEDVESEEEEEESSGSEEEEEEDPLKTSSIHSGSPFPPNSTNSSCSSSGAQKGEEEPTPSSETEVLVQIPISTQPDPKPQSQTKCPHCHKLFSTPSNFRAHLKICKFRDSEDQENAENILSKTTLKCDLCGVGFRSRVRHQLHKDRGCKPLNYPCPQCPLKFGKSSELKSHLNKHTGDKPYKCGECGATFATKGNQVAHSKIHLDEGKKVWKCSQCEKSFNRRYALQVHLNRHNGSKPYPCGVCGVRFSDPSYLTKHRKRVHPQEVND